MLQLDEWEDDCKENDSSTLDMNDDGDIDCISNISDSCLEMTTSQMSFFKLKNQWVDNVVQHCSSFIFFQVYCGIIGM